MSDATGETVNSIARACLSQFEGLEITEHIQFMIRSRRQMERTIERITRNPGLVLFTLVNPDLRRQLEDGCRRLSVPYISALDPILGAMATYLGAEIRGQPGRQHAMDAEYFSRIDAMHFALLHDDGQGLATLNDADVVLVGVSRTSKTPTCIYLANRVIKAANVPIVAGMALPPEIDKLTRPLVIGLTKSPERLLQVRRNRLLSLRQKAETDYVDPAQVKAEVQQARRLFSERNWPSIDVSRRSIEEVAAAVIKLYSRHTGVDEHKLRIA